MVLDVREIMLLYFMLRIVCSRGRARTRRLLLRRQQQRRAMCSFIVVLGATTSVERSMWVRERSQHWWENIVLQTFTDTDWLLNFRMRKHTFDYICQQLQPRLCRQNTHLRSPVSVRKRVAVALWWFATGSCYRAIGHLFGLSKASAGIIVHEVSDALHSLLGTYISIPKGERLREVVRGFEEKGFPQCAGAIDGSHIPIVAPQKNATDYYNRKGWHSYVLQGMVDRLSRFTNINICWPGSVHDARVLRNSKVFRLGEQGDLLPDETKVIEGTVVPLMILGDPAYPMLSWLMKPYTENGRLTEEQHYFNARLSRARVSVECAFGRLKGRWRCLLKRMDIDTDRVPTIVSACCILHNMCEIHGEVFDDTWYAQATAEATDVPDLPGLPDPMQPQEAGPLEVRGALTAYFSRQRNGQ